MAATTAQLDHIMLASNDLASSVADFERLLGSPPLRDHGPGSDGTRKVVFQLENTRLEILAPELPGSGSDALSAHLEAHGPGLYGLALGVDELAAFSRHLHAHGVLPSPRGDSVGSNPPDRHLWLPARLSRGIPVCLVQRDPQPEPPVVAVAEHAITAVDHIVVNTTEGDAAADFYGELLGIRLALRQNMPQWGGDMLFFRTRQMSIEVVANPNNDPRRDSLWGIALRTAAIGHTHQRLVDAGVKVSAIRKGRKAGTRVCTIKSHCLGIPTLLLGSD